MYIHLDQLSRAENSNTTRHAAEFWMIEHGVHFADLEDNMNLTRSDAEICDRICS